VLTGPLTAFQVFSQGAELGGKINQRYFGVESLWSRSRA
jgi:hypothetical protein